MKRFRCRPRVETLENRITPTGNVITDFNDQTNTGHLQEYTPTGSLVFDVQIPANPNEYGANPNGLTTDANGNIDIEYGNIHPEIESYNSITKVWTSYNFSPWNVGLNADYGAVAAYGNYIYSNDQHTGSGGESGILRWDINTGQVQIFGQWSFNTLAMGLDGLLYGLGNQTVIKIDPSTMQQVASVTLPLDYGSPRSIAVAANGDMYINDFDSATVFEMDPNGNTIATSKNISGGVAISTAGKLLDGQYLMNLDFSNPFTLPYRTYHAAFADYEAPVQGPELTNIEPNPLLYSAGQAPTDITDTLQVSDARNSMIVGATISITSGFAASEDVLGFANQNGITGNYDSTTGVMTLTGTASLAAYQSALQSVTYDNTNDNPSTATRTVTFQVDDGNSFDNLSAPVSRDIDVSDHSAPDLANIESSTLDYVAGEGPINITSSLTVSDSDSATIAGATISISSGFVSSEDELGFTNQNGITGSYNDATGVLTLTGTASVADYQTALQSVTYQDSSLNPTPGIRTVAFQVDDGFANNNLSNTQSRNINVSDHVPPQLANIESSALSYTEGNAAETITSSLTVSDSDSATIASATVSISGNFAGPEDVLGFANQNGISGTYNAATGVLTLSGTATVAQYQTALRSVTYLDNSQDPSTATRAVTFRVDDGFAFNHASNTQSRNINVIAINNAPTLTVPGEGPIGGTNSDITLLGISTTDVDGNGGKEDLTLTVLDGVIRFNSLSGIAVDGGANNSASVKVGGSIAELNAALANGNLIYRSNANFNGTDTLSLTLDDNGNTGLGGPLTVSGSLNIRVSNHVAPVLAKIETSARSYTEGSAPESITGSLTVSDSDSPTLVGATIWISQNFVGAEDVLGFANKNGISGSYDPSTGVLTLSGTATVAAYQTALRSVTYVDKSQDPSTATRIISFRVDDGAIFNNLSNVATRQIAITAVNNPPFLIIPGGGISGYANTDIPIAGIMTGDVDANGGLENLTLTVSNGVLRFTDLSNVGVVAGAENSKTITIRGTIADLNTTLGGGNLIYHSNISFIGTDTLSLSLNDNGNTGAGGPKTASGALAIHIAHAAPMLANIESSPLSYTEGQGATFVTATMTLTDSDSTTISSAKATIVGYIQGQDVLEVSNQNGITGSWNASTGVLTLNGKASVNAYQTALNSVMYWNTSQNPSTSPRAVAFQVNDGASSGNLSNTQSRAITVIAVNTPPVLTVPSTGPSGTQGRDIALNGISTADVDANGGIEDLTLSVGSGAIRFVSLAGVTVDGGSNDSPSVTIGGTIANLNKALAAGNLFYDSNPLFTGTDTLSLLLNDNGNTGVGGAQTDSKSISIIVTPHVAPILAGIETSVLSFTEGNSARAVTGALSVADSDSSTIASAKVWISQNFSGAEDVLGFTNQNGITGSYDASTGILTLSGTATVAQYQTALRSVTYRDNSQNPSTAARAISFQVNDGAADNNFSNIVSRNVTVIAVNTPPALTVPPPISGAPNTDIAVNGIVCSDVDANGGVETLTLKVSHGTIRFVSLAGLVVAGGSNGSALITVNGTLAQLNAALSNSNLIYHGAAGFTSTDTLNLILNDNGNTGTGGAKSVTGSVAIKL